VAVLWTVKLDMDWCHVLRVNQQQFPNVAAQRNIAWARAASRDLLHV